MSAPEYPAETEAKQILNMQKATYDRQEKLIEAVNTVGGNVQWIIDNVQGLFQMFGSPQFMSMMPQMLSGMKMPDMEGLANATEGNADGDDGDGDGNGNVAGG